MTTSMLTRWTVQCYTASSSTPRLQNRRPYTQSHVFPFHWHVIPLLFIKSVQHAFTKFEGAVGSELLKLVKHGSPTTSHPVPGTHMHALWRAVTVVLQSHSTVFGRRGGSQVGKTEANAFASRLSAGETNKNPITTIPKRMRLAVFIAAPRTC